MYLSIYNMYYLLIPIYNMYYQINNIYYNNALFTMFIYQIIQSLVLNICIYIHTHLHLHIHIHYIYMYTHTLFNLLWGYVLKPIAN